MTLAAGTTPSVNAKQLQLSVLVVNWKSKDYLRRCLQSVRATCSQLAPQIVVVDGGSFDGCGEMLSGEFPEVEFVQSPENIGFGRSNNLGFERVTGGAVLLLNPDTELRPGAAERLLRESRRWPDAGILGPRLLNSDGSLQTSCVQSLPTPLNQALDSELLRHLFPRSKLWGVYSAFRSSRTIEVEAVSGACMLLRSEVFRRAGGFSDQFFMYGEDMDLCARLRKQGFRVYHVPEAEVVHHGGGSSVAQTSEFSTVMKRVATATFMQLNHGPTIAFWYRALQAMSALVRLGLLPIAFMCQGGHRSASAKASMKKWWYVARWAFGDTPGTPTCKGSNIGAEPYL